MDGHNLIIKALYAFRAKYVLNSAMGSKTNFVFVKCSFLTHHNRH